MVFVAQDRCCWSLIVAVPDSAGPVVDIVLLSLSKISMFVCLTSTIATYQTKLSGHPELQGHNMAVDGCGHAIFVADSRWS